MGELSTGAARKRQAKQAEGCRSYQIYKQQNVLESRYGDHVRGDWQLVGTVRRSAYAIRRGINLIGYCLEPIGLLFNMRVGGDRQDMNEPIVDLSNY